MACRYWEVSINKSMKKLLALFLLSPLVVGEDCVGLPGKQFQQCLKDKISSKPNVVELECTKVNKSRDVFFSVRLLKLLPAEKIGKVESVLYAEKLKSKYSSGGIAAYIHNSGTDKEYRLSKSAYEYEWNDLPDYKGIWQDSSGNPSKGLLRHLEKPHNTFKLNRESLKLTLNYRDKNIYQCEVIENIDLRKSFYENEVKAVLDNQKEIKVLKEKEQEKKNKI
jgi:hypothetical protein